MSQPTGGAPQGGPPGAGGPPAGAGGGHGGPPARGPPPMAPKGWLTDDNPPCQSSYRILAKLVKELEMEEVLNKDGGIFRTCKGPPGSPLANADVCFIKIYKPTKKSPPGISKIIHNRLKLEMMGMDAHMIFAFGDPDSAVPHFTLDAIRAWGPPPKEHYNSFHLDMMPRSDVGIEMQYLDEVYLPLNDSRAAFLKEQASNLAEAELTRRQLAIMSPYMLAYRCNEASWEKLQDEIDRWSDRFIELCKTGITDATLKSISDKDFRSRDKKHRAVLFSPQVDPVWAQVDRIVGKAESDYLQELLKDQSV